MNDVRILRGRGAVGGKAEGPAMASENAIQGWSGVDEKSGRIIEKGHPFEGMTMNGAVLVLSGGKGSNGWSCHFHAAKILGITPAAMLFPKMDARTASAAAILGIPVVTDFAEDIFDLVESGDWIQVDGDSGIVRITKKDRLEKR